MATCVESGWATGPWAGFAWGGAGLVPGGPLPFNEEFDAYCVGPCGEMAIFIEYDDVLEVFGPDQFYIDPTYLDFVMTSGGPLVVTDTARIYVDVLVDANWTLECTFRIDDMPSDFSNLVGKHVFIGNADRQGGCAGLFFSAQGIQYTGSVQYDGSNNLVLNSPLQLLPNSVGLVQEGEYYTLRLVVDSNTQTTFIYVTETAQVPSIGHQLKYILPTILSETCVVEPEDGTYLSIRGTIAEPTTLTIDSLCLGRGLLIPNIPPVADAGVDQAARACSVVRLDGRASFDPEGASITYSWRLIDGPPSSEFVLLADDGYTVGVIQTNKFYSNEAQPYEAVPGIVDGDVLLLDGEPHTITGTGLDGFGFYIQVDGHVLSPGLSGKSFRILKQNTISGKSTAQPTFYPDVPGLYKFDLTVFDGGLFSPRASTVVNVTESPVPRGCTPDVRFLWNYLSDFWRLVDGTEMIEVFWGALAQIAATELLTLWQHEYSKSIRDIPRTHQRRWLHYDLYVEEPLIESTEIRTLLAGVQSKDFPIATGVAVGGTTLDVIIPGVGQAEVYLTQPTTASPADVVPALRQMIERRLGELDNRFTVEIVESLDGITGRFVVRAPFPFAFLETSTASVLFDLPSSNDLPRGSGGVAIGINSYRVDRSLDGTGVQAGDFLVVDGMAFRIVRVVSDAGDPWTSQRLVLSETTSIGTGADWVIVGPTTSSFIDFYNALCSKGDVAIYEVIDRTTNEIAYVPCDVLSAAPDGSTCLLTEHGPIVPYLADTTRFDVFFHSVYRRTYMPVDPLVVEIATLQEKIKNDDDKAVLRQNIDFFRTTFRGKPCIRFVTGNLDVWQGGLPPKRMWAETTYIDNRPTIEQNFGIPAEFTLDDLSQMDDNVDYLSIVRGLWYAYFTGPTVENLRVGTQILLGLPFAEETGIILEIEKDFSSAQGRILMQDKNEQAIVRSYTYPRVLDIEVNPSTGEEYAIGDEVSQFSPLVQGAEVADYIKDPLWFQGYLQQGSFFEIEKFFKFLVRVDIAAFNLSTLLFAKQFIKRIKPTYTFPVLVVRNEIGETSVNNDDTISYKGYLTMYAGPQFHETDGQAQMFDQPRPGGGGYWNHFDQGDPNDPIFYPTTEPPTNWGFDQYWIAPSETLHAVLTTTLGAPTLPPTDSVFFTDVPVFTTVAAIIEDGQRFWVPTSGFQIGLPRTSTVTTTIDKGSFFIKMICPNNTPLVLTIYKNGVLQHTENITMPFTGNGTECTRVHENIDLNIPVVPGDILHARLAHGTTNLNTYVESMVLTLGDGQDWNPLVNIGPGTFKTVLLF